MIIMPRFFVDQQPQDGVLTLTGENAHHAGRVLRLRVGEGVTLCDGAGMDFDCTVEAVEKEAVTCRVVSCHAADTEPKQSITLFMALPKGDKMEFIVQKAVELGVSRIVPYLSKNAFPDRIRPKRRWNAGVRLLPRQQSSAAEDVCRRWQPLYRSLRQSRRRRKAKRHCFSTKTRGGPVCAMRLLAVSGTRFR